MFRKSGKSKPDGIKVEKPKKDPMQYEGFNKVLKTILAHPKPKN